MAVGGDAVTGHHHERVGERLSDRAVRNLEDHHGGTLPTESREAGAGQAFASRRIEDIVIGDGHALLPAGIEHRGLKSGGPSGVRVRFRRDIEAALAGAANDLEEERCVSLAHARHVDHVQRGTRRRRVGDHLLQPRHAAPGSRVPPALA